MRKFFVNNNRLIAVILLGLILSPILIAGGMALYSGMGSTPASHNAWVLSGYGSFAGVALGLAYKKYLPSLRLTCAIICAWM